MTYGAAQRDGRYGFRSGQGRIVYIMIYWAVMGAGRGEGVRRKVCCTVGYWSREAPWRKNMYRMIKVFGPVAKSVRSGKVQPA